MHVKLCVLHHHDIVAARWRRRGIADNIVFTLALSDFPAMCIWKCVWLNMCVAECVCVCVCVNVCVHVKLPLGLVCACKTVSVLYHHDIVVT